VIETVCLAAPAPGRLEPWDAGGKESFADVGRRRIILKNRTGVVVELGAKRWRVRGDLNRNLSQLVNVIGAAYGLSLLDEGACMIHASAVVGEGRAVAIVGQSGSGKSSVAVRLMERGFDYLANDRLFLKPQRRGVQAYGIPKLPRVNPGTLLAGSRTSGVIDERRRRSYRALKSEELWDVNEKYDLDVGRTLGRHWLLRAPLGAAFVLRWHRDGKGLQFRRLNTAQAVEELRSATKTFGPFDLKLAKRSDEALRTAARAIPFFVVTGATDPPALAKSILSGSYLRT
jgi:HprK-related kinase B